MIANPEYDLAKPLASALKAKAPYVGIPLPGHAPLIFRRDLLVRALKGVRPVHIAVIAHPDVADRWLVVDGVADESPSGNIRVRHHMKVRAIRRNQLYPHVSEHGRTWQRWLDSERKPKVQAPLGKHAKAIAKLERQLENLGDRPRILNPTIVTTGRVRDEMRETWSRWRAQRKLRGKVGAIAKAGKTSRELYAALKALGLTKVRTFSDLNTAERCSLASPPDELDRRYGWEHKATYLNFANPKNLWKFQLEIGGNGWYPRQRPCIWGGDDYFDSERWGAKRYAVVLEWSRERQELLSQIAGIRTMMEPQ